jgi:hypothetical protein
MNSGVRIIKRGHAGVLQSSPCVQDGKTGRQSEREVAGTVKNWIAELAQRKRADEQWLAASNGWPRRATPTITRRGSRELGSICRGGSPWPPVCFEA